MLISVIFFLFISLAIISGLVSPTVREFKNANVNLNSKRSYFLAESGNEDAYFRLKNAKPISSPTSITLDENTVMTTITDSGYNEKTITSLGNINSYQRKSELVLDTGDGVSFSYGIQAGVGGFELGNAVVNGNVYSNGTIEGANGATITGSAFSAGASGLINNIDIGTAGIGDARAHNVIDSTIAGNLYCQTGTGNDKSCDTSQSDPVAIDMPITQVMIDKWKADANINGDPIEGDLTISEATTLGSKKITGNLAINADLTITGTIYVVGNITTNNGAHVSLSSSYGATGGIIITDGRVTLNNLVEFFGSGSEGSYVLLATTSSCPSGCSGANALEILNNVGAILVNAQNGTVHLNNNVELNEVVGNKIIVDNSAEVNYLSGLASTLFTSGPTGGWNIKSWKEVE
ncbi:MAG: hypothetical protein UV76_C0003G0008 [Candidatus Nomurabacteria bacterium GW2011_GWA2_43_15]|uniref:Uncharacterized protein n=1 Tax=Candidatus Nomurabacteria bacterium GW2011_GWA2_43_15 TaxID=1618738 RepID=A0A0G1G1A8_9BACT|nr:MAG: hypothetical protein UV76_C0003G0008 [Candidatus Nomurabacteria bacterium GW2011_GWA2_43_15]KKT76162.1 MAG: hypothetical protein UW72_C0010G0005 [Parcubacteria group bacterium GW2011_GWF2_44_7]